MPIQKKPPKRVRAVAPHNGSVGSHRYQLFRKAWLRIALAEEQGFYLEAITLIESILSDRLESRASYVTRTDKGYSTLGSSLDILRKHEKSPEFIQLLEMANVWRDQRNRALHEMVKFEHEQYPSWESKLSELPRVVAEGKTLLREFAAVDERDRAKNGARPPATWPHAFS